MTIKTGWLMEECSNTFKNFSKYKKEGLKIFNLIDP